MSTWRTPQTRRSLVGVTWRLATLLVALGACACGSPPPIRCTVSTGEAIARYSPTTQPTGPNCAKVSLPPPGTPGGEPVGVEVYVPDPNISNADATPTSFAIMSEYIGARIQDAQQNANLPDYPYTSANPAPPNPPDDPDNVRRPFAWGQFDSVYPDSTGACTVSNSKMRASNLVYPAVPMHKTANTIGAYYQAGLVAGTQDQTAIAYEWSNVRVIVTTEWVGTQMYADLKVTQDDCSQDYAVSILVPRVQCGSAADSNVPDNSLCGANPTALDNPLQSQLYGSGIGVGIPVACGNVGPIGAKDYECLPCAMTQNELAAITGDSTGKMLATLCGTVPQ
jgi:hypothetical protein